MNEYTLIATTAFGLESVVVREIEALGYSTCTVENGFVSFKGKAADIARCNLWLRSADRVLIQMSQFTATDFEELYQGTRSVKWEEFIPENGKMHITGKSVKSKLYSVSDCQSIVKRAVIDAMKRRYRRDIFSEDGPVYKIEVSLLKNRVTLTVDTSGPGLHKRGYSLGRGEAPLRETLAAGIVLLSRWEPDRILADPFCGSGTIPIEAALIACNIAPGLSRKFAAEEWPSLPSRIWDEGRMEARESVRNPSCTILASDNDFRVFKAARENAQRCGVSEYIIFQKKPFQEFSSRKKYGCIITNPPYGERIGRRDEAEILYKELGQVLSPLDTWSFFILSSHPDFIRHFGRKDDRNRKLYNGKIQCYLHQYFGPLPPR